MNRAQIDLFIWKGGCRRAEYAHKEGDQKGPGGICGGPDLFQVEGGRNFSAKDNIGDLLGGVTALGIVLLILVDGQLEAGGRDGFVVGAVNGARSVFDNDVANFFIKASCVAVFADHLAGIKGGAGRWIRRRAAAGPESGSASTVGCHYLAAEKGTIREVWSAFHLVETSNSM